MRRRQAVVGEGDSLLTTKKRPQKQLVSCAQTVGRLFLCSPGVLPASVSRKETVSITPQV